MRQEKILIVEDERIIALDLQRRLIRFEFPAPVITTNGLDALKSIDADKPDIILMDIMLSSDFDGIETATIIKEKYNIPLIFLTAYSDEKTVERAKKAEPYGYILKPFKEKELYTTIDIALYKFESNEKLKKQERWSAAILHSIDDGIIATNQDGLIEFMNPVAEKITNYIQEDVKNLSLDEIFELTDSKTQTIIKMPTFSISNTDPFLFKDSFMSNKKRDSIHIDGSIAAIIDKNGNIEGQVLAFRDITEKHKLSQTISYQSKHDTLTGLLNREWFSKILQDLIDDSISEGSNHAFLYMDLDQFKVVNDVLGHTAGDEMLLTTTNVINKVIRSSDTCARLGGDEFGILLEGAHLQQALFIAKRLQSRLVESKVIRDKQVFNINTSIGIVMLTENSIDLQSVLAAADDACFIAKDEGGKKITVYNDDENLFVKRRGEMQWISRLTKALEEHQFELFFQPIEPLDKSVVQLKKCELLIRMKDGNNGHIPPNDFLPSAERYKLMPAIDRWVINNAFLNHKLLSDKLGKENNNYMFSVNLSPDFLAEEDSLDFIIYKFEEYEIDPKQICFEITETTAIGNMQAATDFIHKLKDIGCLFSLDDFGSGFSSFNYLKNLPVDFLKIDGIFVKDMDEDSVNRAMVKAINSLGQVIGLKTIAEFVRNSDIIDELRIIGVDYIQGYEIGKPEPISGLIENYGGINSLQ
jgi:diguanylate cyclase (GGDEF)-like protein/PAS domain S-box-containing protein